MDERRRRFEALALPHLDAARNLACWLARSTTDADDVVQEAMVRAFRSFDSFRGTDARPWLLAIVRNCHFTAHQRRRDRGHASLDGADLDPASPDPTPEDSVVRSDERRKLDDVLSSLPKDYREILILREMDDMSYRDIATATGMAIGTVMSRLARARAALRERWLNDIEGTRHDL
jgi:RNA polymerase sigma factor (sigma-70 family)